MLSFQINKFPDLVVYPFIEAKFYLCMGKKSKYIKNSFNVNDLYHLPIISITSAFAHLTGGNDDLNIKCEVNDLSALIALVKQDIGVGLVSLNEYNLLKNVNDIVLKQLPTNTDKAIYFACVLNEKNTNTIFLKKSIADLKNL